MEAGRITQRHQQYTVLAKSHNLRTNAKVIAAGTNKAKFSQSYVRSIRLYYEPSYTCDRADALHRRQVANLGPENVDEWGNR